MYEGSGTTRGWQIFAGILLGLLTGLCLLLGLLALYVILFRNNIEYITFVICLIFTPIGVVGLLISIRLITARGAKKGAGLLAPNEYRFVGYFFVAISIFLLIYGISHSKIRQILLSPAPLVMTYFCFRAARFRDGMKDVPKWTNLNT